MMTHGDRVRGPSGGREVADDVVHRQGFAMPRIATTHAPCRKPWQTVSMGQHQHSLVLRPLSSQCAAALCRDATPLQYRNSSESASFPRALLNLRGQWATDRPKSRRHR